MPCQLVQCTLTEKRTRKVLQKEKRPICFVYVPSPIIYVLFLSTFHVLTPAVRICLRRFDFYCLFVCPSVRWSVC